MVRILVLWGPRQKAGKLLPSGLPLRRPSTSNILSGPVFQIILSKRDWREFSQKCWKSVVLLTTSTPQGPLKIPPQIPSTRDHKAVDRGTFTGCWYRGHDLKFPKWGPQEGVCNSVVSMSFEAHSVAHPGEMIFLVLGEAPADALRPGGAPLGRSARLLEGSCHWGTLNEALFCLLVYIHNI